MGKGLNEFDKWHKNSFKNGDMLDKNSDWFVCMPGVKEKMECAWKAALDWVLEQAEWLGSDGDWGVSKCDIEKELNAKS